MATEGVCRTFVRSHGSQGGSDVRPAAERSPFSSGASQDGARRVNLREKLNADETSCRLSAVGVFESNRNQLSMNRVGDD
jgi:hypothetical protein